MKTAQYFLITIAILATLHFCSTPSCAQAPSPDGWAFEYSVPQVTGLPVSISQPSELQTALLWIDQLARNSTAAKLQRYISTLQWNDTAKFLAKIIYEVVDDNPLTLMQWPGNDLAFSAYKIDPDWARLLFQKRLTNVRNDSGRIAYLLSADIIAHVVVADTSHFRTGMLAALVGRILIPNVAQ